MDRLWAPWRKAYIRPEKGKKTGCIFCRIAQSRNKRAQNVLRRNQTCFAVLNLYPYTNGHILVLPNRHVKSLSQLSSEERLDWLALAVEMEAALRKALKPHGFNLGVNLGRSAGAGIPGHLHLHVVPRWKGDANFMPAVGGVRVISESLDSVYRELVRALNEKR